MNQDETFMSYEMKVLYEGIICEPFKTQEPAELTRATCDLCKLLELEGMGEENYEKWGKVLELTSSYCRWGFVIGVKSGINIAK